MLLKLGGRRKQLLDGRLLPLPAVASAVFHRFIERFQIGPLVFHFVEQPVEESQALGGYPLRLGAAAISPTWKKKFCTKFVLITYV